MGTPDFLGLIMSYIVICSFVYLDFFVCLFLSYMLDSVNFTFFVVVISLSFYFIYLFILYNDFLFFSVVTGLPCSVLIHFWISFFFFFFCNPI